jgi:hypothetical protein
MNNCIDCGKKLSTNPKAIRCLKCSNIYRWKDKKYKVKVIESITKEWKYRKLPKAKCIDCNKELFDRRAKRCNKCNKLFRKMTKKHTYCIDCGNEIYPGQGGLCKSCAKKGKRNNAYVHGKARRKYLNIFLNKISKLIRKRDNYICQLCHKKGICVHHIDYNKRNNKEDNLITLCNKCHAKTNWNRKNWIKIFRRK